MAKDKKSVLQVGNVITGSQTGGYRILEKIAEGGCGQTFKAEHILSGGLVCIKDCCNVSEAHHDILIHEALAIWDIRHHSIPAVHDLIDIDGDILLVMSYISGLTLEQHVQKHGRIDPESMAWITERCLDALNYLHWHSRVHGDIKPQNIIIEEETHEIVMVDYGLAMVKPDAGSRSHGYTEFFAPSEQVARKPLLPQSDFYSLGMTMIYGLSGKLEMVAQKKLPTDVPEPLIDFIKRLIVRDALARPNGRDENLCQTIQEIRVKSFGRKRSGMKPIGPR